ncbi:MAG TPA: histidinol-phosphatase [Bacteroidales bacterium]|jgi:histidinol-phosphatase (PHP family)|nr:histidinol-phosphatase [Bacteroidales bacterium]
MIYRTDYHIHSTFSDGRSAPEEYVEAALKAGLNEIGFSEHLTLFLEPQSWNMNPERVHEYINYIEGLKKNFPQIKIRKGLEVDYFPGKEKETGDFLKGLPLDYVIGSVHYQGDVTVDLGPEFYEGQNVDDLYKTYFDTVINAVESGLFDIIGHPDLIRIYGYKPKLSPEKLYRRLAEAMYRNNTAFEVNTNGRNRVLGDFYPDRKFLNIFLKEKVPVCVNSDAHMPRRVAQYFDEAYDLLRFTGFTEMAAFEKRERRMLPF